MAVQPQSTGAAPRTIVPSWVLVKVTGPRADCLMDKPTIRTLLRAPLIHNFEGEVTQIASGVRALARLSCADRAGAR